MNLVIDDTVEECKDGTKNNIGMVVSFIVTVREIHVNYVTICFQVIRGNSIIMLEALERVM